jgi:hypothetical protein
MIPTPNLPTLVALIFISSGLAAQSVPERFGALGPEPRTISYTNSLPLNEEDGHLQGVQFHASGGDTFVLTGSSSTSAYYLVVSGNRVTQHGELSQRPLRHAGGFQIADNFLAVGVEDNDAKDRSEVRIHKIDGSEIDESSSWTIKRDGAVMRATAGAVGLVKDQEELLIVVADWDARNLDFYRVDLGDPDSPVIAPFDTIVTEDLSKKGWVDDFWYSYQNLNLILDDDGKLYLFGLGTDEKGQNVGDLYELYQQEGRFDLKKLSSKIFQSDSSVSFQAGAGVYQDQDGRLQIISCSNHVGQAAIIQVWD